MFLAGSHLTYALIFFCQVIHKEAIASLISASVFPLAIACSISASEMASFEPNASKSFVNGISNFLAIYFTFSLLISAGAIFDSYWPIDDDALRFVFYLRYDGSC